MRRLTAIGLTALLVACGPSLTRGTTGTLSPPNDAHVETGPFVHPLFSSHMVLQRTHATVYGWAAPNTPITVQIPDLAARASTVTDAHGRWRIALGKLRAGGPYTMVVSGPQSVSFTDVLIGEVWLSSGQSNSRLALDTIASDAEYSDAWHHLAKTAIAAAHAPSIRLFVAQARRAAEPQQVFADAGWRHCTPDTVGSFSAEAYLFARNLQTKLGVPVGIIEASKGGSHIREWIPQSELASVPGLQRIPNVEASQLYNGMIAPFRGANLAGVLWYQGAADADSTIDRPLYQPLLTALIGSWRALVGDDALPFLVVQLQNRGPPQAIPVESTGYAAAPIREAQRLTVQSVPRTGLTVTVDIGDANTIHPPNKWDLGARLAAQAEALVYQLPVTGWGPLYRGMRVEDQTIRLTFEHTEGGLVAGSKRGVEPLRVLPSGALTGFAIADASFHWVAATATLDGDTVVVGAPSVTAPVAVRYGWGANPPCNLYNGAGFAASPFRTDTQPL